jgi:hypothetical protein
MNEPVSVYLILAFSASGEWKIFGGSGFLALTGFELPLLCTALL